MSVQISTASALWESVPDLIVNHTVYVFPGSSDLTVASSNNVQSQVIIPIQNKHQVTSIEYDRGVFLSLFSVFQELEAGLLRALTSISGWRST